VSRDRRWAMQARALLSHRCPRPWGLACVAALLSGCQTPALVETAVPPPLPSVFRHVLPATAAATAEVPPGAPFLARQWWRSLGSDELNRLVDRALANNPDLRIATLQIVQAKVRSDQVHAGGLPTITAPLRSAIQAPGGSVGTVPVAGGVGTTQKSFQTSLAGTFRLDVWGEQSGLNASSDLQLSRAIYERENVQRNVISGLVSAYVGYLALNDAVRFAQKNETVAHNVLRAIEQRVAVQDATLTELEQQRAALFVQQAVMPALEQQREDARNTIAQLLGTVTGAVALSEVGLDALALPSIALGLPSSLLLQRPDVRMVEARMRAAHADIGVARARLLPPVDLSAQAGASALSLAQLLQPQSLFWNAIASVAVTVFDGGRRAGDTAYAKAYYEEMVATYGRTVYQAVREVDSALASVRNTGQRLAAQQGATKSALNIFNLANSAYAVGAIDLGSLLDAQRNYQKHQDELQHVTADAMKGYANLAQSLGAGADLRGAAPKGHFILVDGAHFLPDPASGYWEVELPGVFHESAIEFVQSDMGYRFPEMMGGRFLRGEHLGHAEERGEVKNAWYRLSVAGFQNKNAADAFCAALLKVQQSCRSLEVVNRMVFEEISVKTLPAGRVAMGE
jgi:multidrug efflux system outer membrane protein